MVSIIKVQYIFTLDKKASKGQYISKANYDIFDASKKWTKHTQDTLRYHYLVSRFTDL